MSFAESHAGRAILAAGPFSLQVTELGETRVAAGGERGEFREDRFIDRGEVEACFALHAFFKRGLNSREQRRVAVNGHQVKRDVVFSRAHHAEAERLLARRVKFGGAEVIITRFVAGDDQRRGVGGEDRAQPGEHRGEIGLGHGEGGLGGWVGERGDWSGFALRLEFCVFRLCK